MIAAALHNSANRLPVQRPNMDRSRSSPLRHKSYCNGSGFQSNDRTWINQDPHRCILFLRDRETWAGVARFWYSRAADKSSHVGRLHHHLAILTRLNALGSQSIRCLILSLDIPMPHIAFAAY
ncbi:uncharacterized protein BDZ99DRAFT_40012 [Mytilinidion resinicola]|uniref:Uncharacterized protein n=1 Tax=Mytilinidion resinicola TaxID=574789 RepID=A0A6A6YIV1_9PEZI|nr:uncharacterized protein BDZ99DRAFT_40012 [Mytilinidion resinicola]KAF2808786.1 hypothetical protein BDZ99DRAFT_40012 [Mytilinidion resinicola]